MSHIIFNEKFSFDVAGKFLFNVLIQFLSTEMVLIKSSQSSQPSSFTIQREVEMKPSAFGPQ